MKTTVCLIGELVKSEVLLIANKRLVVKAENIYRVVIVNLSKA